LTIFLVYFRSYAISSTRPGSPTCGAEALRLLREEGPFDFVISGWHMTPVSGLDLLKAMCADPSLARVPVVLMSVDPSAANAAMAKAAGAMDYLVKPFSAAPLRTVVLTALARN
jgi:two-component system chemotaxis response regulator CheY